MDFIIMLFLYTFGKQIRRFGKIPFSNEVNVCECVCARSVLTLSDFMLQL